MEREKKRRGRGIRGKVDKRLRSGGEMRLGEGKVGEQCCRSGFRQGRLQNTPAGEDGGDN